MPVGGVVGVDGGHGDEFAHQEAVRVDLVQERGVAEGVAVPGRDLVVGGELPGAHVAGAAGEAVAVQCEVLSLASDVAVSDDAGRAPGDVAHHVVEDVGVHARVFRVDHPLPGDPGGLLLVAVVQYVGAAQIDFVEAFDRCGERVGPRGGDVARLRQERVVPVQGG